MAAALPGPILQLTCEPMILLEFLKILSFGSVIATRSGRYQLRRFAGSVGQVGPNFLQLQKHVADFADIVPPAATENLPPRKKKERRSKPLASLDI